MRIAAAIARVVESPLGRAGCVFLGSGLILWLADLYPPHRFRIALLGGLAVGLLTLWFFRDPLRIILWALVALVFAWVGLLVTTIATVIWKARDLFFETPIGSGSATDTMFMLLPPDVTIPASFGTLGIAIVLGTMYLILDARSRQSQQAGSGGPG
jgi:hypothetical protein